MIRNMSLTKKTNASHSSADANSYNICSLYHQPDHQH